MHSVTNKIQQIKKLERTHWKNELKEIMNRTSEEYWKTGITENNGIVVEQATMLSYGKAKTKKKETGQKYHQCECQ